MSAELNFDANERQAEHEAGSCAERRVPHGDRRERGEAHEQRQGQVSQARAQVLDGEYKGRKVWDKQLNIQHENAQTQKIAQGSSRRSATRPACCS
jgi:hypothetical protein